MKLAMHNICNTETFQLSALGRMICLQLKQLPKEPFENHLLGKEVERLAVSIGRRV